MGVRPVQCVAFVGLLLAGCAPGVCSSLSMCRESGYTIIARTNPDDGRINILEYLQINSPV